MLIGMAGYAQSGKSEVGRILTRFGFKQVAFADPVREFAEAINPIVGTPAWDDVENDIRYADALDFYGYEETKKRFPESRRLLQAIGTEGARKIISETVWLDVFRNRYDPAEQVVVTDVRFPNEAELIRELGGEVWRIHRPGVGPLNDHPSETGVDRITADQIILNDGQLIDLAPNVRLALSVAQTRQPVPAATLPLWGPEHV